MKYSVDIDFTLSIDRTTDNGSREAVLPDVNHESIEVSLLLNVSFCNFPDLMRMLFILTIVVFWSSYIISRDVLSVAQVLVNYIHGMGKTNLNQNINLFDCVSDSSSRRAISLMLSSDILKC